MNNPYIVLDLPQSATPSEIVKAQVKALRARKFTQKEITEAQTILRKPALRLAADFMYPILDVEAPNIKVGGKEVTTIDVSSIDANKYDSLKR